MVLLIKARDVRAQMLYCFMRNLRAIFAFACLLAVLMTCVAALKPQRDKRDISTLFLGPANAAAFAAIAIYAHKRLRTKSQ